MLPQNFLKEMITIFKNWISNCKSAEASTQSQFYKSQWQQSSDLKKSYLIYRWIMAIVFCVLLIAAIVNVSKTVTDCAKFFIYLTHWGFILCTVQAVLAACLVNSKYREIQNAKSDSEKAELLLKPSLLLEIYSVMYTMSVVCAFGITIIFWTRVYVPSYHELDLMVFILHGFNTVLMLLDVLIVAHPLKFMHFVWTFGFVLIYLFFSYIYYLAGGTNRNLTTVVDWARDISEELWKIGSNITKLERIQKRYQDDSINASVEKTDGKVILETIATRMNKLIKEKVDAVLKIKNAAMNAESLFSSSFDPDNVTYYNSKFSKVVIPNTNLTIESVYESPEDLNYSEMVLSSNPHFENVLVNTTFSSVHVPTNIFDRWENVIRPIQWSEMLDETFRSNYETDSSIMWQYFASTTGFLRHYPGFHWAIKPDRYDCRDSIWYIQAATCSKEVVILIDNSGTMYGMKNTIAQLTVDSVLKTFSNNDYINVFRLYEDNVTCLVPCFDDTLIQATPENIDLFKKGLYSMCPEKKINYKKGFSTAYRLLHDFIEKRTDTDPVPSHNQAIFLLSDTLPSKNDLKEILEEYQTIYNDTNIQVELFVYFIGKDIPDIREIQWETCLRNGSIVHVRTMDEVPEDALKYLSVMARTQNESTEYYPVSWTHIFLDIKKDKGKINSTEDLEDEEDENGEDFKIYGKLEQCRIMTSVSAPVYSSKAKKDFTLSMQEEMIGVAAIDVPVSDFERLTMAHKIGVNGYAFVVTNNGYLLFHPDLRPVKDGAFRKNFNSVDLTEVEFYNEDERTPRKPHEKIVELRRRMVNQDIGNMTEMFIKFHYDDQKRVGCEQRNYFFAPLKCSPFSLGLALPRGYGNYWVKTTNEIIEKSKNSKEDYKKFFKGNWQIHPKWSYCDYRDNRKYSFSNAKEKLMTFFDMIFHNDTFVWVEEHIEDRNNLTYSENYSDSFESCFANDTTKKPSQPYFCDKELLELLYFDAKLTQEEFPEQITKDDIDLMKQKKIRLKFVATQGGLTRWQNSLEYEADESFGEKHGKALEEVWYKSAVLLHEANSQTFVFSVPKTLVYKNKTEKFITAAHAIFHKQGEIEAPGVVVGFQIAYDILKNEINKFSICRRINLWECYIIDHNGYVIHSPKEEEIGTFFGSVDGGAAVMDQMVNDSQFREITMFDYQALDDEKSDPITSSSTSMFSPLSFVVWMINWALSRIVWLLIETNIWQYVNAASSCSSVTFTNMNTTCSICKMKNKTCPVCCKAPKKYSDACQTREVLPHIEDTDDRPAKPRKRSVDKKFSLYLNTGINSEGYKYFNKIDEKNEKCSRPFYAVKINKTNLILIAVNTSQETCPLNLSIEQKVIIYDSPYKEIPGCNKRMINSYPRKKLRGCSDKIPQNRTRELCGSGSNIEINISLLFPLNCFFLVTLSSFFSV